MDTRAIMLYSVLARSSVSGVWFLLLLLFFFMYELLYYFCSCMSNDVHIRERKSNKERISQEILGNWKRNNVSERERGNVIMLKTVALSEIQRAVLTLL